MAYTNLKDQNILFKQGSQDSLNALITNGNATEGAFYLTNDTHRLYIGRKDSSTNKVTPIAVNEGIVTVANVAALSGKTANAGEFYYAAAEKILCVYNGQQFVQINPDTDTNTVNASMNVTVVTTNNASTVTHKVIDSDANPVSDSFILKDSTGANEITSSGKTIDIQGDKYTLSGSVSNNSFVSTLASEHITGQTSSATLKAGENITIANVNGTPTISSTDTNTTISSVETKINNDATITVTLTDSDNNPISGTSTEKIYYIVDGTTYINGEELPVYSEEEIDKKLKGLNGLTYKGTKSSLPESASIGDMYLVTGDISIIGELAYEGIAVTAKKGDLIIATGTEDENTGLITSATLKWSHVPSGDEVVMDTTYSWVFDAATNKFTLKDSDTNNIGGVVLAGGEDIDITSNLDTNVLTATIKHSNNSCNQSTGTTPPNEVLSITAVTKVTPDNQGHVSAVETTTFNIKDTTYSLSGAAVSSITGGVKIVDTLKDGDTNPAGTSELSVTSDTLTLTAGTNAYSVNLCWGEF